MTGLKDLFSRRRRPPAPLIPIRPELLTAVEKIAVQENLPPAAIVDDLLRFALAERQASNAVLATWELLTEREKEVAALIGLGMTNPDIAARLVISENTVKTHIRNIFAKFGAHSKDDLRRTLATLDLSEWERGVGE